MSGPDSVVPNPKPFGETNSHDNSFLGNTCEQWEGSILPVIDLNKRLVILRTGIVLSNEGGAFAEFKKPLKFGIASVLGSGKQIISWIDIKDIVGLYIYAIENEKLNGVFNAVAPQPVSNKKLIQTMVEGKGGVAISAAVPAFALKIMFGEMSIEILKGATVSSKK